MVFIFPEPEHLADHFTVLADTSQWNDTVGQYMQCKARNGKNAGQTPRRERASFKSWGRALTPTTDTGRALDEQFGIYVLAFNVPTPAVYVGIAARGGRRPEGFLNRFRKHRVKLTGSHVGNDPGRHGGVNHTGGWREWASERARHFSRGAEPDVAEDARFSVWVIPASGRGANIQKDELERVEARLVSQGALRDALLKWLWPGRDQQGFHWLNSPRNRGGSPVVGSVQFGGAAPIAL